MSDKAYKPLPDGAPARRMLAPPGAQPGSRALLTLASGASVPVTIVSAHADGRIVVEARVGPETKTKGE